MTPHDAERTREPRVTHRVPDELNHDCDRMHLESYEVSEVVLPEAAQRDARRALRIVVRGHNLEAMAQPLTARVGDVPVRYLRIAPDERSIEGVLLEEPRRGDHVEVFLGEMDQARHPRPFDPAQVERID